MPARSSRFAPFALASLAVLVLSIAAYTGHVPAFVSGHGIDKLLHATMSATLTALLARALNGRVAAAALFVMVPIGADEYLQRYSGTRASDWGDIVADLVGIALAIAVTHVLARQRLCASQA